ncbi:serine protease, putative [Actinidia rufa]|uniref:Serine protease, putative n=1 Tax=Actinidia rufa TaxID=165716 RepID=A0A7J0EZ92_9ERIC|nr:serine protease, putative [Actinidia rufa]
MATLPTLLSLLSLSLFSLSHCHSIRDLLTSRGLPAGLFPDSVRAYDLDPNGLLQVFMDQPCTAKFETRVFFESVVRANLSYGGLIGIEGLSQEELFLWLPVKDIIVYDPSSGLILFDIGVAHKEFSLSLFEDPPVCMPQGVLLEEVGRKELGFQVQR